MKTIVSSIALAAVVATMPACNDDDDSGVCDEPVHALLEMPDIDMLVGDTVKTFLHAYFDALCHYGEISFTARSTDPAVASSISEADTLTIVAVAEADSVRVDVTATDIRGGSAFHDFFVRVEASTGRGWR